MKTRNFVQQLSLRETEVLLLCDQGFPKKLIADELGLSLHTVATYCRRICDKTLENGQRVSIHRVAWLRR